MKVSVLRYAAIGMATLSLAGFAAASTTVGVSTTGADSDNNVHVNNTLHSTLTNHNNAGVANLNLQGAGSGNVKADKNTSAGGDLSSGDASNTGSSDTTVSVSNKDSSFGGADLSAPDSNVTIDKTGADSDNNVHISNSASMTQTNTNNVKVLNFSLQSAKSGNVNATKNTEVGGLSSGDATNDNTTTTDVEISN